MVQEKTESIDAKFFEEFADPALKEKYVLDTTFRVKSELKKIRKELSQSGVYNFFNSFGTDPKVEDLAFDFVVDKGLALDTTVAKESLSALKQSYTGVSPQGRTYTMRLIELENGDGVKAYQLKKTKISGNIFDILRSYAIITGLLIGSGKAITSGIDYLHYKDARSGAEEYAKIVASKYTFADFNNDGYDDLLTIDHRYGDAPRRISIYSPSAHSFGSGTPPYGKESSDRFDEFINK